MIDLSTNLAKGFFPKEIPSVFSSAKFALAMDNIPTSKIPNVSFKSNGMKHCISKTSNHRRYLTVPNPANFYLISKCIFDNIIPIKDIINSSKLSIFSDLFSKQIDPVTAGEIFNNIGMRKVKESSGKRYLLYVDIQNFYPSIYTHSIPWIIHTISFAKSNRGDNYYGNLLDRLMRNSQDGETYGIPIGPYISFIISEIINSKLDELLLKKFPNVVGVRGFDDRYLYFDNKVDLHLVLNYLNLLCKDYRLELNAKKTKIKNLPESYSHSWVHEIRKFSINNGNNQSNDLIDYFSHVFRLAKKYPEDNVVNYALGKIYYYDVIESNWELYYRLLLHSTIQDPLALSKVISLFAAYLDLGYKIKKDELKKIIYSRLDFFIQQGHTNEILWILYLARICKIKIKSEYGQKISEIDDPFIACLAIKMDSENLINGINSVVWGEYLNETSLKGSMWLFAYEAGRMRWNTDGTYLNKISFFKYLNSQNVSFLDWSIKIYDRIPFSSKILLSSESVSARRY